MTIEEIVYQAHELGIREELFNQISKMRGKDKYRYTPLNDMYEIAIQKVKERKKVLVD